MKRTILFILTFAAVMMSVVSSGCDNKDNKSDDGVQSSVVQKSSEPSEDVVSDISVAESKPEITKAQLNDLDSFISSYKDVPEFTFKAENINAKEIADGKSIMLIPDNSNYTFTSLVCDQFKTAAKTVGFSKTVCNKSDGTTSFYSESLNGAIGNSDIVLMYGDINKDGLATDIERTQANGVRVMSVGNMGRNENDHYVDYTMPIDYNLAGKLLADWSIVKNSGKVNALVINNSDSTLSTSIYRGFADEFKKYVTSGYCTVVSGSSLEIQNGLSVKIKQSIDKDPNLNYVVVLDEAMINDAVSGVEQSGKDIKVISTGGGVSAFEAAENGSIEMLVAQSYEWTAYAMVDYALRILNRSELPSDLEVPVRVITKESIKNELEETIYEVDGFHEICFGSNFLTGYTGLWNL